MSRPLTEEQLAKVLPLACRAALTTTMLAMREPGSTDSITAARRDELLAKVKEGAHVELELDLHAYEQEADSQNRNFVRFRDGAIQELARSGKGTPFLRDHQQDNSLAKGGVIVASAMEKGEKSGSYAIKQTVRLTAPWAVELALRGLLSTVSIGWNPTGPVMCSACNAAIGTKCYHWPGARLAEVDDGEGGKRKVRKADGPIVVQWVFTKAELVETSAVPVPAVPQAHVEGIRAALSAQLSHHINEDGEDMDPKLLALLGLAATAGEAEVIKAVDSLKTRLTLTEGQRDEMVTRLTAADAKVAGYEQALAKSVEDKFIADAIGAGKLIPGSQFESALRAYHAKDAAGAAALIASTQPATHVGAPRQSDGAPPEAPQVTTNAEAIAKHHGASLASVHKVLAAAGMSSAEADKLIVRHVGGKGA